MTANYMTVAGLIKRLKQMPQDARVVLENHYDGLDDADEVEAVPIVVGEHCPFGIGGAHEQWGHYMKKSPHETAVVIR